MLRCYNARRAVKLSSAYKKRRADRVMKAIQTQGLRKDVNAHFRERKGNVQSVPMKTGSVFGDTLLEKELALANADHALRRYMELARRTNSDKRPNTRAKWDQRQRRLTRLQQEKVDLERSVKALRGMQSKAVADSQDANAIGARERRPQQAL